MGQLTIGAYTHEPGEVGIKIDKTFIEDSFRRVIGRTERWTIVGAVKPTLTKTLAQRMADVESAYSPDNEYGDIVYDASPNEHRITNDDTFSGIRMKAFGWSEGPWKMATELANRRTFYAVVQAEFRDDKGLFAFKESITIIGGGGPRFHYNPSLNGVPQLQTTNVATTVKYIQRGKAIGRFDYITANSPLWPAIVHNDQNQLSFDSPQITLRDDETQKAEMYVTEWVYVHESPTLQTFSGFALPDLTVP